MQPAAPTAEPAPRWGSPRWFGHRLGRRIVGLFLALLLVVQALSFFATRASIDRNARAEIGKELKVGGQVFRRLLAQNAQKLSDGASLLAADYGFRSAVNSDDIDTISSVLANHGERIGASITLLLDTAFEIRASAQPGSAALKPAVRRLARRSSDAALPGGRPASEVVALGGRAYQMVMVPMRAPLVIGWVVMGFPLDERLVNDLRDVSNLHATLLVDTESAEGWAIGASTLDAVASRELAQQAAQQPDDTLGVTIELAGHDHGARSLVLDPDSGGHVRAVLVRSIDEAVAPYRQLQLALALLTLLGVAIFAAGSVVTARRITTPVRALVQAADRLGRGDYGTPVDVRSADEIGELAQAFERMRENVDAQQREIVRLAYWDTLTGLPNRVQFRDATQAAIEAARGRLGIPTTGDGSRSGGSPGHVSVLMLDIDRFKHVNDVLGYEFGDRLLRQVAERLAGASVRAGDLVARLSGDEFAVLLPDTDAHRAQLVAERMAAAFVEPLVLDDQTVDLGASIGVATSPDHATEADALMSRAEVAMYAAKRRTAGVLIYDPSIDSGSAQTLSLLSGLRRAVDHGELRLYLQPKVSLDEARVVGAEALVRWHHPKRGLVPPMEFIPFAEQTGFIRTLTAWVAAESLRTWRVLNDMGLPLALSVNLSTRDLMDPDLPQKFGALLDAHGVPAEALCLEITESAIMDDPARALQTLERLNAMGFHLSIDDFGTGYSSLAYLKRLPVDELKIDKSFVMQMTRDSDDAKIVRSTIDLAHNLGLSVVAEGVETPAVWRTLRSLDCDLAQGYLIGRPMPGDAFAQWAAQWNDREGLVLRDSPNTMH